MSFEGQLLQKPTTVSLFFSCHGYTCRLLLLAVLTIMNDCFSGILRIPETTCFLKFSFLELTVNKQILCEFSIRVIQENCGNRSGYSVKSEQDNAEVVEF